MNSERKCQRVRDQYITDPETKRQKMHDAYKKDLESKRYIKKKLLFEKCCPWKRSSMKNQTKTFRLKKIIQQKVQRKM